jgi:predicted PhzF superfamily epimerase YddE/YHI9
LEIYQTNVFHWGKFRGNRAVVALAPNAPAAAQIAALTERCADATLCVAWRQDGDLQARCFADGAPVFFCGHGLFAMACIWHHLYRTCANLRTQAARYHCDNRAGELWLCAPRLRCRSAILPPDIEQWFDQRPLRGATAGDAHGYLILEWPRGTDLATLRPAIDSIKRGTTRAIIATQAGGAGEWSFTLRYFAPHFTAVEDSATGSANAVLADYWANRGLGDSFRALQVSPQGGVIRSRVDGRFAAITGNFHITQLTG